MRKKINSVDKRDSHPHLGVGYRNPISAVYSSHVSHGEVKLVWVAGCRVVRAEGPVNGDGIQGRGEAWRNKQWPS